MSVPTSNDIPLVLTVPQLAELLCVSKNTAYDSIRSGRSKSIRIGHQIRISNSALMDFLAT